VGERLRRIEGRPVDEEEAVLVGPARGEANGGGGGAGVVQLEHLEVRDVGAGRAGRGGPVVGRIRRGDEALAGAGLAADLRHLPDRDLALIVATVVHPWWVAVLAGLV